MTVSGESDGTQVTVGLHGMPEAPAATGSMAGVRIGRYRLVSLLGRGGMGEVYAAEQDAPVRRTVAFKLLRARHLDTRRLSHFEIERQLLAQMRHPAIAQIFDAGTTAEGRPYSVMELIDGVPVTDYCRERRLSLSARIALFVRICEGVQHAHQKGVVHRDLKPGNILVTEADGRALPKIIDFGIASVMSAGSSDGSDSHVQGTPAYMSPEQASAPDAVDTRSDIYSLGVLLHELLCGARPEPDGHHAFKPSQRLLALPREEQARLAGVMGTGLPRLVRVLEQELDWIVARATARDRSRRFASITELSDDLQRFLDGFPLAAVPAGRRYALTKFAGRHRVALSAAAIVLLALLGGLGLSLYGLERARVQQALAEQRARQLETVSMFQQSMLEEIDIASMGVDLAAALRAQVARTKPGEGEALERVLAHVNAADVARDLIGDNLLARAESAIGMQVADQPMVAADLRESVAQVRRALGMHGQAAEGFGEVAGLRAGTLGRRATAVLQARRAQLSTLLDEGSPERHRAALGLLSQLREDFAALPESDPLRLLFEFDAIRAETAVDQQARRIRLEDLWQRSRALLGERDPATLEIANSFAILATRLGELKAAGDLLEALLPLHADVLGDQHPQTRGVKHNLAVVRIRSQNHEGAIALQRELVEDDARRLGAEHPLALTARGNLANMLNDSGRREEALTLARSVLDANRRVLGPEHPQTIRSRLNTSSILAQMGHFEEALGMQREVIEARTRLLGPAHPDTLFMRVNRPATLHQAGRTAEAFALMAEVLPQVRKALGEGHPTTQMAMDIRAMIARESGDFRLEIDSLRTVLGWRQAAQGDQDPNTAGTARALIAALRRGDGGKEADALWARYIQPVLDMAPDLRTPAQRRLVDRIGSDGA